MKTLFILALLSTSLICCASQTEPTFSVELRSLQKSVAAGTVPRFELKVTNVAKRSFRVLRLDRREDWQQAFARLMVRQKGKDVRISQIICDPGVVDPDEDFIDIASGKSMVILLKYFAQQLEELEPGDYEVSVSYWPDYEGAHDSIRSNVVPLKVVPRKEPIQPPQTTSGSSAPTRV